MSKTIRKRTRDKEHDIKRRERDNADALRERKQGRTMKPKAGETVVNGVRVSDHAVIRFLEIVMGFDIRRVRETILGDDRWRIARREGFCKLPINGTAKVVVRDGVVVTVLRRKKEYDT